MLYSQYTCLSYTQVCVLRSVYIILCGHDIAVGGEEGGGGAGWYKC